MNLSGQEGNCYGAQQDSVPIYHDEGREQR